MIKLDFSTPPAQTIALIKSKAPTLDIDYNKIDDETKLRSFFISKITKLDTLTHIQNKLVENLESGKGYKDFIKDDKIASLHENQMRLVYETNIRTAYSTSRYEKIMKSSNEYIRYNAILNSHTRPLHQSMHGVIKHKNDPWWHTNFPPNGFRCRCFVTSHSAGEVKKRKWKISDTKINVADTGFENDIRKSIDYLQNIYYQKAIKNYSCKEKNAKNDICFSREVLKETIKDINTIDRNKEYKSFIDTISTDKKAPLNSVVVGSLNIEVFDFLYQKNIVPLQPLVYLTKSAFYHMTRDVKKERDRALNINEIKEFVNILSSPILIVWDNSHKNVLYFYNNENTKSNNKIVIEINYKNKKDIINNIVTSGIVDYASVLNNIDNGVYEIIFKS